MNIKNSRLLLCCAAIVAACGGTTISEPAGTDGGTGGSGGGGHQDGGSGGSVTGGSGGTVTGGSGGTVTGGMGGTAGTGPGGGGSAGMGGCAPLPSCNWCGGTDIYDSAGCIVGYMCPNGADPCSTGPCDPSDPMSCPAGTTCGPDMLCWPGSPCGVKECKVTPIWGCDCDWSCPDGNDYTTRCVPTGSGAESCECLINGQVEYGCAHQPGSAGGPGDWCGSSTCCGFPQ